MKLLKAKARSLRREASGRRLLEADESMNREERRQMKHLKAKARLLRKDEASKMLPPDEIDESTSTENDGSYADLKTTARSMLEKLGVSESSLFQQAVEPSNTDGFLVDSLATDRKATALHEKAHSLLRDFSNHDSDEASISITDLVPEKYAETKMATFEQRFSDSLSSLSSYFDSFRSQKESKEVDKRHLLYLGQKSSDETMAQIVVEDKDEWHKLQLHKSCTFTSKGKRRLSYLSTKNLLANDRYNNSTIL